MSETRPNLCSHCIDRGPKTGRMNADPGRMEEKSSKFAEVERCLRMLEEDRLLVAHLAESADKGNVLIFYYKKI